MFTRLNRPQIKQCLVTHRKHVKRRLVGVFEIKRQFSSGKYSRLGDLYARLGLIGRDVSQDDIKKAYYELSKEHHPDRNEGCSVSAEKFRRITEAYEILGNTTDRAQYDKETPFGRLRPRPRRTQQQPQHEPDSAFSAKDDEIAEKIRAYRANMRKRTKKPLNEEEEFAYRRANMFDFDAWYRAHFNDDFDTKLRDERVKRFEQQYREQMERITRGDGVRPPKRFVQPKEPSEIDIQMEQIHNAEVRKEIENVLMFGLCLIVTLMLCVHVIEPNSQKGPYVDPYPIEKRKESTKNGDN